MERVDGTRFSLTSQDGQPTLYALNRNMLLWLPGRLILRWFAS